jgi:hypothetical protein
MSLNLLCVVALALLLTNLVLRALVVALSPPPRRRTRRRGDGKTTNSLKTMVVLGSGGHTAEMFAILRALDGRAWHSLPGGVRLAPHRLSSVAVSVVTPGGQIGIHARTGFINVKRVLKLQK